ncbi:MAG TPA: penicillin-binding transpeptidase domain-containing protein [Candidatus Sulfotelmatobacter sp.]|jgi:penicillin-binding protein 2|nr:penicillin-binding transpeptidase domain-containing protein [Candidatus Sulfotelmatobacter sp.]
MLVVDELKKNDPSLRLVALVLAGGLFILFVGLWWVQVVKTREYQVHREAQAYRTVRLPAIRGKILDREGRVLADNRARYNLCLYFDDLNDQFKKEYDQIRPVKISVVSPPFWKFWSNARTLQTNRVRLKTGEMDEVAVQARGNVVSRAVAELGRELGEPLTLDLKKFTRSYAEERAMPFTILQNLDETQIAKFQEKYTGGLGAQIVLEPEREYPNGTMAAHLLGETVRETEGESLANEDAFYNYRLPDYVGKTGIEGKYNNELHGRPGVANVLVNNMGYRISEDVDTPPQVGADVTLTVDLDLQRAAEDALANAIQNKYKGNEVNGAVVVMDVRTGDVLAMASWPVFDPNNFAQGWPAGEYEKFQESGAEKDRAISENYAPGSIFKTVVALAALDNGMNPGEKYHVEANPRNPHHGAYFFSPKNFKEDTAPPGDYDFLHAFIHSSNSYFMNAGLKYAGIENVVRVAQQFHLGERTGVFAGVQETHGHLPSLGAVRSGDWRAGNTANVCIGQGEVDVTPMQMAVMVSAIANSGAVLWPRLVEKITPQDFSSGIAETNFPDTQVRNRLTVRPRSLQILRDAMFYDVQGDEGSGRSAAIAGLNICAKTGTAQVQDEHNRLVGHNYWFASYAPAESPHYAIVAMLQSPTLGGSGGDNCGPVARDIYEAILKKEAAPKVVAKN